ncbi:MAG TPA: LysM domain-containing protein [Candidatus Sulfomarinibacteraceae bacterium]|nr:LysM domain-containing protein [Candidatus Sulfomarinibacteraceae bacterium]
MQRSTVTLVLSGLFVISLVVTGCRNQDNSLPTLVPRSESVPLSEDGAGEESPRDGQSASGIPPTWTPQPEQEAATPLPPPESSDSADGSDAEERYVVQSGDTLAEIAAQFSVDLEQLAQVNNIVDIDRIEVGQELIIPR